MFGCICSWFLGSGSLLIIEQTASHSFHPLGSEHTRAEIHSALALSELPKLYLFL